MMRAQAARPTTSVSYLIVLLVLAVEALNLVLLWVALRGSMPRWVRPVVASVGLSGAWGAWILALVIPPPGWLMALTVTVFAVSSVAMGISIHLATVEEEDRHEGGGPSAPAPSPESPDGGPNDEPLWWPDFERQVAAYAEQHDREPETTAVN
jgi:hypothetical protein